MVLDGGIIIPDSLILTGTHEYRLAELGTSDGVRDGIDGVGAG